MPYIKQETRQTLEHSVQQLVRMIRSGDPSTVAGELNYVITRLVAGTFGKDKVPTEWSYNDINLVVGVLECAKQEFYDRVARPKEDLAVVKNGDVPEYHTPGHMLDPEDVSFTQKELEGYYEWRSNNKKWP